MYRRLLLISSLTLGLSVAPVAFADRDRGSPRGDLSAHGWHEGHRDRHHRPGPQHGRHDREREERRHRHEPRHDSRHRHAPPPWHQVPAYRWSGPRYHVPRYQAPRGYSSRYWKPGHRLPADYRQTRYVVHDYRAYHLHTPPRGHQWLRVDQDVVLAAVATGVIAAVIHGIFQ